MRYYIADPEDNRTNVWLFGYDDPRLGHRLFPDYDDLVCTNCGKLDEPAAIARGINPAVCVQEPDARRDLIGTEDGQLLVSCRFADAVRRAGITGLNLLPLPGDGRFFLAQPATVPADLATAGVELHGPYRDTPSGGAPYLTRIARLETADHRCVKCGRFYELCLAPALSCMALPAVRLVIFAPSFPFEKQQGTEALMYCSEDALRALKKARLRGLQVSEAY